MSGRPSFRGARLDSRLVVGVVLVLLSVAGGLALYRSAKSTVGVVAVAGALDRGRRLEPSDLHIVEARLDPAQLATVVPARDLARLRGRYLVHHVGAGELLPRSALGAQPAAERSFSLVVGAEGLTGDLLGGDSADVLATFGDGPGARTEVVATALEVVSVREQQSSFTGAGAYRVTLLVTPDQMLRLEHARRTGVVTVAPSAVSAPAHPGDHVTPEDFGMPGAAS